MDAEDYHANKTYMEILEKFEAGKELTNDEFQTLENNLFERPPFVIPRPCPLIILDDLSHSEIYSPSRKNPFINLCLRHRHINNSVGISIFMAVQNFRSGIPLVLRQNMTALCIWATRDENNLKAIYEEIANLCNYETFLALFNYATAEPHAFLVVDSNPLANKKDKLSQSSPFRKNFDTFLVIKNQKELESKEHESDHK